MGKVSCVILDLPLMKIQLCILTWVFVRDQLQDILNDRGTTVSKLLVYSSIFLNNDKKKVSEGCSERFCKYIETNCSKTTA